MVKQYKTARTAAQAAKAEEARQAKQAKEAAENGNDENKNEEPMEDSLADLLSQSGSFEPSDKLEVVEPRQALWIANEQRLIAPAGDLLQADHDIFLGNWHQKYLADKQLVSTSIPSDWCISTRGHDHTRE
jgi:hypothetical protein